MIIVDTNILISAVNKNDSKHRLAVQVLESVFGGGETVGLPWMVLVGFIRIATHRRVLEQPLSLDAALAIVKDWLRLPNVSIVHPGAINLEVFSELLRIVGIGGNLTTDAHIAAIAIEQHATVYTFDADFARFPGLQWRIPE